MTTVNLFNATPQEITIQINDGPALHLPGTGATSNWVAQQPEEIVLLTEDANAVGQFKYVNTTLLIRRASPSNAPPAPATHIVVPALSRSSAVNSLQLYIFQGAGDFFLPVMLQDGVPIFLARLMTTAPLFN